MLFGSGVFIFGAGEAQAAISFIGSCGASANNGANVTVTLPVGTVQNDLVLVAYTIGDSDNVDHDMAMITTGYTEVADLFSNDTFDTNLGVYWKVMGATPDTTAVANGLGGSNTDTAAVCMVFRGVDTTTPMDVTPTTATALDTFNPNPPSIDHNNPSGVWTVIAGANAHNLNAGSSYTFPTGYTTNAVNQLGDDTNDATVGLGYKTSPSDPEDPGVMTHTGTDSGSFSWAAASIALRPGPELPTVTTNFATPGFNSATLHGTKTGGGDATQHGFAYSTDSTLTSGVSTTTLDALASNSSFYSSVGSLSADTPYYYRAYATNTAGTGYGTILSFTTGNATPARKMRLFEGFRVRVIDGRLQIFQQ